MLHLLPRESIRARMDHVDAILRAQSLSDPERAELPARREKPELSIDLDRGLGRVQHRRCKIYGRGTESLSLSFSLFFASLSPPCRAISFTVALFS